MDILITVLTSILITYELFKIIVPEHNWKYIKYMYFRGKKEKDDRELLNHIKFKPIFLNMFYLYFIYYIILFFTTFWWFSILLILNSLIISAFLSKSVVLDKPFNNKILFITFLDNFISIILMIQIIN